MGEIIEFPTEDARLQRMVEAKLKDALSGVPEPKASEVRAEIVRKWGEHRKGIRYKFELNLPADTDPAEVEKIKDSLAKVASFAAELSLQNLALTAQMMLSE